MAKRFGVMLDVSRNAVMKPEEVFGSWDSAVKNTGCMIDEVIPECILDEILASTRDTIALKPGKPTVQQERFHRSVRPSAGYDPPGFGAECQLPDPVRDGAAGGGPGHRLHHHHSDDPLRRLPGPAADLPVGPRGAGLPEQESDGLPSG